MGSNVSQIPIGDALERLHDAHVELVAAALELEGAPERHAEARERLDAAKREWAAAVPVYDAKERLHDAYEQLVDALHDRLNGTGLLLRGGIRLEHLAEASERLGAAEPERAAAVASADELIAKGGE